MPIIVGLDHRTKEAMRQFFKGQVCCKCQAPAERFVAKRFYCHGCLSGRLGYQAPPVEIKRMKDRQR